MFLQNLWYFALPGGKLRRGCLVKRTLLGEQILIGRAGDGTPFALQDVCPHRGMPLSYGHFDGREIECCYHGWRFDTRGTCVEIPSLVEAQREKINLSKICVSRFACREVQGNIWIYFGDDEENMPSIPEVPQVSPEHYQIAETMEFPSDVDHAVVGLMDPAHGPFVHRSWWWRSRASIHEKEKRFEPSHLGFRMLRHRPSSNSRAYRVLGGAPETEISFQLPGVRIEHVQTGKHVFCGLTAVTPISEQRTLVNHVIYWTMPWLSALRPLIRPFARAFLNQDRRVVARQQEGLGRNPKLMLINDADMQARWYYRLKAAFEDAQTKGCAFENPIEPATLRWRS